MPMIRTTKIERTGNEPDDQDHLRAGCDGEQDASTTQRKPTGGNNAKQSSISSERFSYTLRDL
jgi:hypothetical protein